ncbi:MAG TPA: hypothetical protein VMA96_08565 [Solirubrobacteraceae bacterium]|nr:hypothetical protein [Solirubrobacteraceae bacterium]
MTEQLETELRAALRERAAEVPGSSIARLVHHDYRPRTRRLRPPVAIGALASAAGTVGAVAVVISLTAGASSAFAGWSATPTPPSPGQLAASRASCEGGQSPIAGLPLKLADTRGPFTFSVYASDTSSATCISGPSFTAVSGTMSSAPADVPAGQIMLSSSHQTDRGGQPFSFAEGRTGAGVSGVTLTLNDGTKVQATVGGGWFVAWWPGARDIKSADLATPTGTVTQTFNLGPEIPCRTDQRCSSGVGEVGGGGPGTNGVAVSGFASGGGSGQASSQNYSSSR